ncbi:serine-rich single-pass membrane protein 1 [Zootoca vivipara]|uniref:serine-rich single-pass membrane protein 1 n=1 Tax=Zootoca vivipara TaxID=8524 RepID=UPI00293BA1CA|nr:serine-rich single-pass membrane protein 1 [Zootoca vivipara]
MAFPFPFLWWIYSRTRDPVETGSLEEFECDEEVPEEDDICWGLGEILLYYCLAVAAIRIIYIGADWIVPKCGGGIQPCKKVRYTKGCQDPTDRCQDSGCGILGCLRKLFAGECERDTAEDEASPSSPPPRKETKERLSKVSQQSFCDSDSVVSSESQVSSWKGSQTADTDGSASSARGRKMVVRERSPRRVPWMPEEACPRCKAKRTREWLAQHFFDPEWCSPGKHN